MKISPDVLKPHPLLALLPYRKVKQLVADSAVSEYPKGTVVFREGAPCDAIFLIISGRCEARIHGRNGASVVEDVYGPGDTLGDRAFLNQETHRATVTVTTHCVLLRIPAAELEGIFTMDPKLAGRFSQTVTRRAKALAARRAEGHVRRVVSLLSLAPRTNAAAVAAKLASSLITITDRKVLLVRLIGEESGVSLHDWALREAAFDNSFSYERQLHTSDAGYDELRLPVGSDVRYVEAIAPLISHCGRHYDYVLLHIDPRLHGPAITECVIQADLAYVLLQPSVQCLYDFELLTSALSGEGSDTGNHVKPVVIVEEPFEREEFHETFKRFGRPVHSFARGFPLGEAPGQDRRFLLHINRLAREIARCRIGLALSSGGAKGLAHVGVIQALEENGIEIDAIAGSSMGAYVGALYAHGLTGAAMEKNARELEGRWGLLSIVDPVLPPRRGILRTTRVARRLRNTLGDAHFSDLLLPLRVLATNLATLERVVFSTGDVVNAVEASIAIPGICVPVAMDGEIYVDGGIADPLPIDVLEEMGIERIIAVNVIPTPQMLRYWRDGRIEANGRQKPGKRIVRWIGDHLNYFAPGNVFDTMIQAMNGVQMRLADANTSRADVVLRPVLPGSFWHDFTRPGKYIALGRSVAEAQLQEIKALVTHPHHDATSQNNKTVAFPSAERAA